MKLLLLQALLFAVADASLKPQMGWNSWNTFKANINESTIKNTATALVKLGLADAGYEYVMIDAGWQTDTRAANGQQQANATLFPSGIKGIADYVHSLGLKLGIYSDSGIYDCDFHPGSWGYEELDAYTYASWGIDYLKYDNCGGFQAGTISSQERFQKMGQALKTSGRDIFYALCQWGHQFPWYWADQIANSYRMSGDIQASFASDKSGVCQTAYCLNTGYAGVSVLTMIRKMREISAFQSPGSWADMDMLEIGTNSMTEFEEQTHFSFWAALKSPLIIGADITNISASSLNILQNKEVIAISQDRLGAAASYVPDLSTEGSIQVWGGPLSHQYVALALNYGNKTTDIGIKLDGLPGLRQFCKHKSVSIRDIWDKKNLGTFTDEIRLQNVSIHQTKLLLMSC
ncbi:glycoside hydrolase family 27 protein [Hypoxylon trugodes]|uniref:glycoside hydrolase family 27 protein n=1 Tax=Hypoxylon trugodes TaxID=326681 RepID=UPI00219415CF|nr:glycoside hydrolase family 27 protein [Hypoxylon trugodes]KAI1390413.1 glycoside hydrolase family 27 protein [Hypoxylon trugodes]